MYVGLRLEFAEAIFVNFQSKYMLSLDLGSQNTRPVSYVFLSNTEL
jgi:hypothetical protein